jgi:hypothetical protein
LKKSFFNKNISLYYHQNVTENKLLLYFCKKNNARFYKKI